MSIRFITLQLRYRRRNPWPKLYVTTEPNLEAVLRGLPCALIVRCNDMPLQWHSLVQTQKVESGGVRAMKRGDCHDAFEKGEGPQTVMEKVESTLEIEWKDAVFLVPIFQRYLKWKVTDLPEGLAASPDSTKMAWLKDKEAIHWADMLNRAGPPMKLPCGTVLDSCCGGCPYNFQNMLGQCRFGDDTCMEQMDFPGKSQLVQNLQRWVKHREIMAHKDTQPDLPAFGHGE